MAQIARREDRTLLRDGFSINVNVSTVLSEEFLAFDDDFAPSTQDVVLEMRLEDMFADPQFLAREMFLSAKLQNTPERLVRLLAGRELRHHHPALDQLEERGYVGPSKGAEPRDILIDMDGQGYDGGGQSMV